MTPDTVGAETAGDGAADLELHAVRVSEEHLLRDLVAARSPSAAVDSAVRADLAHVKHLDAVDEWLAELEREHGPLPPGVVSR